MQVGQDRMGRAEGVPVLVEPRYLQRGVGGLEMSVHTLLSRRAFGQGLCTKHGLSPEEARQRWRESFENYLLHFLPEPERRALYRAYFDLDPRSPAERLPFYFFVLLDYSLFSTVEQLFPGVFKLDDHLGFDSSNGDSELPFFCLAGQFSYLDARLHGTFPMDFTGLDLGRHLEEHAQLLEHYFGRRLHRVEPYGDGACDVVLIDPPEVSRNECLSTAIILFQTWMDCCALEERFAGRWVGKEVSCLALGDSECRLRITRA